MSGKGIVGRKSRHLLRIKDLDVLEETKKLVTCSSEGLIILWDLEGLVDGKEAEEYSFEAKCRITCVSGVMAQKPRRVKVEVVQSGGESEFEEVGRERVLVTME
jgi:hypothetical protein